jgi:hypothetical protein
MRIESFKLPPRGMRRYRLHWPVVLRDVLMVALLTVGVWWCLSLLMPLWVEQLNFWAEKTGLLAYARVPKVEEWTLLPQMTVTAPTLLPSLRIWWLTALACTALWVWSLWLPRERLPLVYGLRVLIIVQLSALAYFYIWPQSLPTTVATYLTDVFRQSAGLMLLVPLLFGLTLYLFTLPWWVKLGATLAALLFLVISVPLQAASCAWILQVGGILFMPVLYLFFSLLPQVVAMMGIYSFALSFLPSQEELVRRGLIKL